MRGYRVIVRGRRCAGEPGAARTRVLVYGIQAPPQVASGGGMSRHCTKYAIAAEPPRRRLRFTRRTFAVARAYQGRGNESISRALGHPPAHARWTASARLAGKRHPQLVAADAATGPHAEIPLQPWVSRPSSPRGRGVDAGLHPRFPGPHRVGALDLGAGSAKRKSKYSPCSPMRARLSRFPSGTRSFEPGGRAHGR